MNANFNKGLISTSLVTIATLGFSVQSNAVSFGEPELLLTDQLKGIQLPGSVSSEDELIFRQLATGHLVSKQRGSLVLEARVETGGMFSGIFENHLVLYDTTIADSNAELLSRDRQLLQVFDVDGDGWDDVVSCGDTSIGAEIFAIRGPVRQSDETKLNFGSFNTPFSRCSDIFDSHSLDYNNDGLTDFSLTYLSTSSLRFETVFFRNTGGQSFSGVVDSSIAGVLAVGDLDSDGNVDVLGEEQGNSFPVGVSHFFNAGSTSRYTGSASILGSPLNTSLLPDARFTPPVFADRNSNGSPEFISLRTEGEGCCAVYELRNGDYMKYRIGGVDDNGINFISVADLDNDGKDEVLAGGAARSAFLLQVLQPSNNELGGFSSTFTDFGLYTNSSINRGAMSQPVVADIDADGDLDVMINQASDGRVVSSMPLADDKVFLLRQNQAPVLSGSSSIQVTAGQTLNYSPTYNDGDVSNSAAVFTALGLPSWVQLNSANGRLTGSVPSNLTGTVYNNIVLTVDDQSGASNSSATLGPLTITVRAIDDSENDGSNEGSESSGGDQDKSGAGGGGSLSLLLIVMMGIVAISRFGAAAKSTKQYLYKRKSKTVLCIQFWIVSGVALLSAGCAGTKYNPQFDLAGGGASVALGMEKRAIVSGVRKINGAEMPIICAEPSPDGISAQSASLASSVSNGAKEKLAELVAGAQSSTGFAGLRTQSIQILRDMLYRTCEGYMNQQISADEFGLLMRRFQKNMVALLAIEQLTGTVRAQPVALLASSESAVFTGNEDEIAELTSKLEKAKTDKAGLDSTKTTEIAELDKQIKQLEEDIAARKTLRKKMTSKQSGTVQMQAVNQTNRSDETIQKVAETVWNIVDRVLSTDDYASLCLIRANDTVTTQAWRDANSVTCTSYFKQKVEMIREEVKRKAVISERISKLPSSASVQDIKYLIDLGQLGSGAKPIAGLVVPNQTMEYRE